MQIQISWLLQKPTDLDLHCLLRQGMSCSAREGLSIVYTSVEEVQLTSFLAVHIRYMQPLLGDTRNMHMFCNFLTFVWLFVKM